MTKTQVNAAVNTVIAIAEAIRELGRVPSGHLYARVMSHMSFETYDSVINTLKNAGVIKETNSELIWISK